MKTFAADFETSVEADVFYHLAHNDSELSRVYLWCVQEIFDDTDNKYNVRVNNDFTLVLPEKPISVGYDIDSFFNFLKEMKENCTVYFHNLKFDGEFIRYWLNTHGYKFINLYNILIKNHPDELEFDLSDIKYKDDFKEFNSLKKPGTYEYLITNTGVWHNLVVRFETHTVTFRDSLKLFNTHLDNLLKAHDTYNRIGIQKTKLDVYKQRAPNYDVGDEELLRCKNDTIGLAYVLGLHKIDKYSESYLGSNTIGGCAINRFIESLSTYQDYKTKKSFAYRAVFPELSDKVDEFIRLSYRGGWSYLNPLHANKTLKDVDVYDINSMYPTVMATEKMPVGDPILMREYETDGFKLSDVFDEIDLKRDETFFIIQFDAVFIVKPDGLPFIVDSKRILSSAIYFDESTLTLPEPLLELFTENYNYKILSPTIKIILFRAVKGFFKDYIDSLYNKKQQYAKEGNKVLKDTYKLLMNSLYGKFGQRRKTYHKVEIDNKPTNTKIPQITQFRNDYCAIATAITGYAKLRLTRVARSFGKRFVYTDTDSVHILKGDLCDIKNSVDVENEGTLGLWKLEHQFKKAKYLHSKCYIGIENDNLVTTIAGLKKQNNPLLENGTPLTFDNFKVGVEIKGNLKPIKVPGGLYLKEHPFKIREIMPYSTVEDLIKVIRIGGFSDPYYYSKEFIKKFTFKG